MRSLPIPSPSLFLFKFLAVARCGILFMPLLMVGCAAIPTAPDVASGSMFSGRLVVNVAALNGIASRSLSAAFELQGDASVGRLHLSTPLGSALAQARWGPGIVILTTPQGEKTFADLDALTNEVLGESLPLGAMFDWLRGKPWPGATSKNWRVMPSETGFDQLGWAVDLTRFNQDLVVAQRVSPPVVTVRVKLDSP
jgi:outer membrane lipoprotein LolB